MVEYLIVFLAVFTSVIYYSLVDFIEKKIRTNVMLKIIIKTISAFKHPALASTFISFEFMKMITCGITLTDIFVLFFFAGIIYCSVSKLSFKEIILKMIQIIFSRGVRSGS